METPINQSQYDRLRPEIQRLYTLRGDEYVLNENLDGVAGEILAILALLLLIQWDGRRYIDARGRVVTEATIRNRVKFISKEFGIGLAREYERVLKTKDARKIANWMARTRGRLQYWHSTVLRLPFGANVDSRALELIGSSLNRHLERHDRFWRGFQEDVLTGDLSRAKSRVSMHGRAIYTAFVVGFAIAQVLRGMRQERRVLGFAEHCADCVEYAGEGWQAIGTLPEIGDSRCMSNCRCHFEYRREGDGFTNL